FRRVPSDLSDAPPPMICDFAVCHEDAGRAEELARQHIGGYLASVLHHYEVDKQHFKDLKGYEHYGKQVDIIAKLGYGGMFDRYLNVQAWGTPEEILEKYAQRREALGDFAVTACFRYAGMPYDEAARSMRLFSEKVVPELRRMVPSPASRVA